MGGVGQRMSEGRDLVRLGRSHKGWQWGEARVKWGGGPETPAARNLGEPQGVGAVAGQREVEKRGERLRRGGGVVYLRRVTGPQVTPGMLCAGRTEARPLCPPALSGRAGKCPGSRSDCGHSVLQPGDWFLEVRTAFTTR